MLASGTEAALARAELVGLSALDEPRDFSTSDPVYEDLAEFVLSPLYAWDLP